MRVSKPRKLTDLVLDEVLAGNPDLAGVVGLLKERFAHYGKWVHLWNVHWQDETGREGDYQFASRRPDPILAGGVGPDAVVIVPIHVGRSRRLVATHEFRIVLGAYEWGVPAGLKEPGESISDSAHRELKEETGFDLTRITEITRPLYSSAGMTDESVSMVFCECTGKPSNAGNEDGENINIHLLNLPQLRKVLKSDEPISGKVWPIFQMYSRLGKF